MSGRRGPAPVLLTGKQFMGVEIDGMCVCGGGGIITGVCSKLSPASCMPFQLYRSRFCVKRNWRRGVLATEKRAGPLLGTRRTAANLQRVF